MMERSIQEMLDKLNKDTADTFVTLMAELKAQRERTYEAEREFRSQQDVLRQIYAAAEALAKMMQSQKTELTDEQWAAIRDTHPHLPDYGNYLNIVNGANK